MQELKIDYRALTEREKRQLRKVVLKKESQFRNEENQYLTYELLRVNMHKDNLGNNSTVTDWYTVVPIVQAFYVFETFIIDNVLIRCEEIRKMAFPIGVEFETIKKFYIENFSYLDATFEEVIEERDL